MKTLLFISILLVALFGCGQDYDNPFGYSDIISTDDKTTFTFKKQYHESLFSYVVVSYSNGDINSYCELDNGVEKLSKIHRYTPNDVRGDQAICTLYSNLYEYWEFSFSHSHASAKWVGAPQPIDLLTGQALPYPRRGYPAGSHRPGPR